jgi:hypothetical protein
MAKVQELLPPPPDGGLSAADCASTPVQAEAPIIAVSQTQRFAPRSHVAGLATREVIVDIE